MVMELVEFLTIALIFLLDVIFIVYPKVPLLNFFLGLISAGFTLSTYGNLPLGIWFTLIMIVVSFMVISRGIQGYNKKGNK